MRRKLEIRDYTCKTCFILGIPVKYTVSMTQK